MDDWVRVWVERLGKERARPDAILWAVDEAGEWLGEEVASRAVRCEEAGGTIETPESSRRGSRSWE
jgi:hypothetical protein